MTATFFGHRNAPARIKPLLRNVIIDLIEKEKVDLFYVGNNGAFDSMVINILKSLKNQYNTINYSIVLAYLPKARDEYEDYTDSVFPEGIEKVPYRFAICKRNEWMIKQADIVVTYVCHDFGGAAKYEKMAHNKRKRVINLTNIK